MNQPANIISFQQVRVRTSLANWAINWRPDYKSEVSTKKLAITRKNRYSQTREHYKTERPDQYQTNSMVRLLDIWCRLRSFEYGNHLIRDRKMKMQDIAKFCDCSINKLRPALKELHRMQWIHMDDQCITISSERKIYSLCGLEYSRRMDRIFYKPEKLKDEKQTHYWIYLSDIDDNRKRQAYKFHQKIMDVKIPEMKLWVYGVIQRRGYDIREAEADPMLVSSLMNAVYIDSFRRKENEKHDWLVENRPDVNRSVLGMADAWSVDPMKVCYIKKKLQQEKLVVLKKIGTISSPNRTRNPFIHLATVDGKTRAKGALYNKHTNSTFQAFCDDIQPRTQELITVEKQTRKVA